MGVCGSAQMEPSVGVWLANATVTNGAALVVIDAAWNMSPQLIAERTVPLVLQLRASAPAVPILLMEPTPYRPSWALGDTQFNNTGRMAELKRAYTALLAAGVTGLTYVASEALYAGAPATYDPTFEGTHPHDHGHILIAQALAPIVQGILTGSVGSSGRSVNKVVAAVPASAPLVDALELPGLYHPTTPPPADAVWKPAASLALRGRAFNSTPTPFNRLPATAHGTVPDAVWSLSLNSAGLVVGFATDSANIYVNLTEQDEFRPMVHFPVSGVSGLELFAWDGLVAAYRHVQPLQLSFGVKTYVGTAASGVLPLPGGAPRRYKLFLPLYNDPTALSIGVDSTASVFTADEPFDTTLAPVVWYGTSIAQGGVSFKASKAFTNVVATALNREIFNFGFSGNCHMDLSVGSFLGSISSPAAVIVDCLRNMDAVTVAAAAIPLVQQLRGALPPGTPIILVEGTGFGRDWAVPVAAAASNGTDAALAAAFATLVAAGDTQLLYVQAEQLWPASLDSPCANGLHPTDEGNVRVASFWTGFLGTLLGAA
jgi:lysophospholipase L1-like esterase